MGTKVVEKTPAAVYWIFSDILKMEAVEFPTLGTGSNVHDLISILAISYY
jgi:hypothetical protein